MMSEVCLDATSSCRLDSPGHNVVDSLPSCRRLFALGFLAAMGVGDMACTPDNSKSVPVSMSAGSADAAFTVEGDGGFLDAGQISDAGAGLDAGSISDSGKIVDVDGGSEVLDFPENISTPEQLSEYLKHIGVFEKPIIYPSGHFSLPQKFGVVRYKRGRDLVDGGVSVESSITHPDIFGGPQFFRGVDLRYEQMPFQIAVFQNDRAVFDVQGSISCSSDAGVADSGVSQAVVRLVNVKDEEVNCDELKGVVDDLRIVTFLSQDKHRKYVYITGRSVVSKKELFYLKPEYDGVIMKGHAVPVFFPKKTDLQ